jgi:ABC-type sulfate/molybdate transport systems ATPase subunit
MVFQDYALWPHLTAYENVGYALKRRKLSPEKFKALINEALARVGLESKGTNYPHQLSGGEQQRVALARAIVADPSLLLFDEPLSNLDADLRERLRIEISTLTREIGASALYITHDQSEAFALADQIGVINKGSIEQIGTRKKFMIVLRLDSLLPLLVLRESSEEQWKSLSKKGCTISLGKDLMRARHTVDLEIGQEVDVSGTPCCHKFLISCSQSHRLGNHGYCLSRKGLRACD